MKKISYDIIDSEIVERINRNRNFICGILGDTGSGKSYTAMSMGEIISEKMNTKFSIENIVFAVTDAIDLIEQLPKGSVIVLDEAGISFFSREFMHKRNKELSKVLMMFRFKNQVLLWTLPDLGMIDINMKRLMHTILITGGIDYEHELVFLKWFNIEIDRWDGKMRRMYPRVNGGVIRGVMFPKPSDELIEAYEAKKREVFQILLKSTKEGKTTTNIKKKKGANHVVSSSELIQGFQDIVKKSNKTKDE